MPTIPTPDLPEDGSTADVGDYNPIIIAILALLNGGLDADNLQQGSLPWSVMDDIQDAIPAGAMKDEGNLVKYRDEANIGFVASGVEVSSLSGLNIAITPGVVYTPDGSRNEVDEVESYTLTASKDTYIDVGPGGDIGYTAVNNGASAPAVPNNYMRVAVASTNASSVVSVTSTARKRPVAWEELGRSVLGTASNIITLQNLPQRRYLQVIIRAIPSGPINLVLRVNNDSGNNYARTRNIGNGNADQVTINTSSMGLSEGSEDAFATSILDLTNIANREKIGFFKTAFSIDGPANAPKPNNGSVKWVNKVDSINRIDLNTTNTGQFAPGSEVIVYGHD